MTGTEAFLALRDRKNIRRKGWDSGTFIKWTILSEEKVAMEMVKKDYSLIDKMHRNANLFAEMVKELLEEHDDWEVVE